MTAHQKALGLIEELRDTMPEEVLRLWARDVKAELAGLVSENKRLSARLDDLRADRERILRELQVENPEQGMKTARALGDWLYENYPAAEPDIAVVALDTLKRLHAERTAK